MVQRTVLKVDIACQRCRKKLLKAVSGLEGVDKIEVDAGKGNLTVTGNADPYEVIVRARKATGRYAEVVSIGPPPAPAPAPAPAPGPSTKTKQEDGGDQKKTKPDDNPKWNQQLYLPSPAQRSCHACERVYVLWDEPNPSCSIM